MARILIREAHGGKTRIIRDGALPYFLNQGYVVLETLDDDTDASPLYLSAAESDLRYARISDLGDPESAEVAVISEAVADSEALRAASVAAAAEDIDDTGTALGAAAAAAFAPALVSGKAPVRKGDLFLNVKDYGATGDGTTDDTAAVQAAVGAATTGTCIYFPPGVYRLNSVAIDGKTNLTLWAPAAVIKRVDSPTNPGFRIGFAGACTNIWLNLAEIDGNNFAKGTGGIAVRVANTTGFRFDGYIHHTWDHAIAFGTTPSSRVVINLRAEFIGRGYAADNTFSAMSPMGCAVYFATAAPVSDGIVTITGTDIKGAAAVYVAGCNRLIVNLRGVRRTGYRALMCAGANTVVGLLVPDPQVEDCGAVYESSTAPGASLYGQGTNAIYAGLSPVTAQDCVVTGGKIKRCGENAFEGKGIVRGLVAEETGYAYPSFGSGLAKSGMYLSPGSRATGITLINPGNYGVHAFDSGTGLTDIHAENVEVIGAALKSFYFQQSTTGTLANVVLRNITARQGSASPTHGIHIAGTGGGSLAATALVKGALTVGTFSTAPVLASATGGGTGAATVVETTSI